MDVLRSKTVGYGGTYGYMAPEMKDDEKYEITTKLDVFALGMTLLKLIIGRHPCMKLKYWRNEDPTPRLFHNSLSPTSIDTVMSTAFLEGEKLASLKDLIGNMINFDANQRYDTEKIINHRWYQDNCFCT